ncbi:ZINC FINGER FYVE DOMAIN CONTAINING PROTEIN [Salix purpurea]|uniref:ZINC FINGER FYVE DOMAIN CONTAINING PROTEIN n=1 Tax=Salix purpurea TaxID=77065 RepID=A0A9Q0TGP5_SALPP|nr:ZINC FINGER FYVE DOMAIN CONTAINING PROTEIN [Salix purpurea]
MAIRFSALFQILIIYSTSLLIILPQNSCNASNTPKLEQCGFNAIYNLGTSISDTGNSAVDNPSTWQAKFPYGETIHEATGRPSDGLLIIDYIAKSADLPLVVPYKNLSAAHLSACHGVNFAYSGASALSKEALAKKNITLELTNPSLDVQLGWVDDYFDGFCHNVKEDCTKALSSSLFMMNCGTNDYGSAFRQNHSMEEIKKNNLVSDVVEARKQALKKIISRGARKILVFGVALDGCRPISLAMQSANKSATYDRFGCVKDSNDFCKYRNEVLQEGLKELREQHPDVQIVYGDLYNAMQSVFDNFKSLGECFIPFIHNDV